MDRLRNTGPNNRIHPDPSVTEKVYENLKLIQRMVRDVCNFYGLYLYLFFLPVTFYF